MSAPTEQSCSLLLAYDYSEGKRENIRQVSAVSYF
jgi:hypothetical protein